LAGNWSIDGDEFKVLVNDEEQHSLWPSAQPIPDGWRQVGPVGTKQECLDWIGDNWPNIAPLSVRSQTH
jgi:uncharacterized protein YbdZ (MbtH family)